MIRLFVAEKPSVARDLAQVLGATRKREAYIEGDGVWVTWCLGHLVEPAPPEAHDARWKRWDPALLPMLPPTLTLQPITRTRDHFSKLRALLRDKHVGTVVNACDAGREGELIFRYVYQLAGCDKPVLRFWVSSLTPTALRAGLANLRPGAAFDALGAAARCRAEADWLVGMNATRGLTALGGTLLSVGRVQTPTLAMVVEREQAIEAFVAEPYWEVEADLSSPKGDWTARWIGAVGVPDGPDEKTRGRIGDAPTAARLVELLRGAEGVVTAAERTIQEVPPPALHHLTSLQREANRRFGLTADQTLKAAQALYERHKLITYPRTDSRHLTQDVAATVPARLEAVNIGPYAPHAQRVLNAGPPPLGRRHVDDAQVGDHHAIVPTEQRPNLERLAGAERQIYDLVVRRLLAALHPVAVYARTRLEVQAVGQRLEARGRVLLDAGWEAVEPPQGAEKGAGRGNGRGAREGGAREGGAREGGAREDAVMLPPVEPGDPARVTEARAQSKETRPPPRFTDATLLGAMERAGRPLDDAGLRAAMRDCGLGTPATRAATLETLIRRDYMQRQGKVLVPLPAGRALVDALPVEDLRSPRLTAEWEQRLHAIAEGRADAMSFRRDIRRFVAHAVEALRGAPPVRLPAAAMPRARRGTSAGGKSRRRALTPPKAAGPTAPRATRAAPKATPPVVGEATPRAGRKATGRATPRSAPRTAREAVAPTAPTSPPRCPLCHEGTIMRGNRGWGCDRWREGCAFVVWFEHDGIRVPDAEAERLFRTGRTGPFARPPGSDADAALVLDLLAEGRVRWERPRPRPRGRKA